MRYTVIFISVLMTLCVGLSGQNLDDYRNRYTGARDWNTASNWQRYNGSVWVTASAVPSAGNANVITIRNGATIRVNANIQADQLLVQSGGVLQINNVRTLTIVDGSGTDLTIAGQAHLIGNISVNSGATVVVTGMIDFTAASNISGAGSFDLQSGALLATRNANGITASGLTGSVRTSIRSFSSGADYMYMDAAQLGSTGSGLPSTVNRLIINTDSGVALSNPVSITTEMDFITGWIQLGNNNITFLSGSTVTANSWFFIDGTGVVNGLNESFRVDVTVEEPTQLIQYVTELYLLNNLKLPHNIKVAYINCDEYYLDLNGYKLTWEINSIAFSGNCDVTDVYVDMEETVNSATCGTSIARTWTTGGYISDGTLTIELTYPETETDASQVLVWRRPEGETGHWTLMGTYNVSGTTDRTVSISGVTALMTPDDIRYNWTITDIDQSLPVVLASFTGYMLDTGQIRISWVTQSESNLSGFYVLRSNSGTIDNAIVISPLIRATNQSLTTSYTYNDWYSLTPGCVYYYWLECVEMGGEISLFGPVAVQYEEDIQDVPEIPFVTQLHSPYPNPFNLSINAPFDLSKSSPVTISVYNLKGQVIRHLFNGEKQTGNHVVAWDGRDNQGIGIGSGIYIIRMTTPEYNSFRPVIFIK